MTKPIYIYIYIYEKLQLTHMWFDRNLSCLYMVWNLILYPPKVGSVRVP